MVGTKLMVNVARTALRNEPSNNSTFLGYIYRTHQVIVLDEQNGWVKIKSDKITAWALRESFSVVTAMAPSVAPSVDTTTPYMAYVNVAKISVWNGPSMKGTKFIGYLFRNQEVTVNKVQGEWAEITTKYNTGWVPVSRLMRK